MSIGCSVNWWCGITPSRMASGVILSRVDTNVVIVCFVLCSVRQSHVHVCLFVCLSVCLSVNPSVCLSLSSSPPTMPVPPRPPSRPPALVYCWRAGEGGGQRGGSSVGDRGHVGARRDGDRHFGAAEALGCAQRVHGVGPGEKAAASRLANKSIQRTKTPQGPQPCSCMTARQSSVPLRDEAHDHER